MKSLPPLAVYDTATNRLIDYVAAEETAEQALARLATYGTALSVLPCADVWQRLEDGARTTPVEISAAQWQSQFEILPPVAWVNTGTTETFKLSEAITGVITAIYVRIGERCFTFQDSLRLTHSECCERVRQSQAYLNPDDGRTGPMDLSASPR